MTKIFSLLAVASLLLAACSSSNQIAQLKDYNDDVYYSEAKATEFIVYADNDEQSSKKNKNYLSEDELRGDIYDDYRYSGRIRYYGSPWMSPYSYDRYDRYSRYDRFGPWNDFYGYGIYGYNNYNYSYNNWYSPGMFVTSPWFYFNSYRNPYGSYYGRNYGGPASIYTYYPGYSYGAYNGGYYNVGNDNDPNYRARPVRGSENLGGLVDIGMIRRNGQGIIMTSPSRGETFERTNTTGSSGRSSTGTGTTAARTRPTRTQSTTGTPRENPPERVSQPQMPSIDRSSLSGSGSSSGGSSSSSGSSSSGDDGSRARPARAGN